MKELNEKEPRMTNGAENQSRVLPSHRMLSAYGLLRMHSTRLRGPLDDDDFALHHKFCHIHPAGPDANAKQRSKSNTKQTGRTGEARGRCDTD